MENKPHCNECHVFPIHAPAHSGKTVIGHAMLEYAIKRDWNVLVLVGSGREASIWKKVYKIPARSFRRRPCLKGYDLVVVDSNDVTPSEIERMSFEMMDGKAFSSLLWIMTLNETEQPDGTAPHSWRRLGDKIRE